MPIPIRARLVWEHDGEEWIDTQASVWTDRDVLVELADPRWWIRGVWVAAGGRGEALAGETRRWVTPDDARVYRDCVRRSSRAAFPQVKRCVRRGT